MLAGSPATDSGGHVSFLHAHGPNRIQGSNGVSPRTLAGECYARDAQKLCSFHQGLTSVPWSGVSAAILSTDISIIQLYPYSSDARLQVVLRRDHPSVRGAFWSEWTKT